MADFSSFGKMMIYFGLLLVIVGVVITLGGKFFNFGRLPGDIVIHKGNFGFYFPIVTSIILSVVLTIIVNIFIRR